MAKYSAGASLRVEGWFAIVREKDSGKVVFEQKCENENQAVQLAFVKEKEFNQ